MYRFQSSQPRVSETSTLPTHFLGYLVTVSVISIFIALRLSLIPELLVSILLVMIINLVLALRRHLELYGLVAMFGGISLLFVAVRGIRLYELEFLVDPLLGLSIVVLIASYKYIEILRDVLTTMTPFVILVSTLIGTYLGIDHPIRYLLLTIIDVLISSIIYTVRRKGYGMYVYSALNAIMLYTSPLLGYTRILAIGLFIVLHLARNIFMFREDQKRRYSGLILDLDLLLKPLLVMYA